MIFSGKIYERIVFEGVSLKCFSAKKMQKGTFYYFSFDGHERADDRPAIKNY